ncbi:hypothetical protein ACOMHN_027285 [Nucella lapillus]
MYQSLGVALSRPSNITKSYEPISQADREFLKTLPTHRGSYPAGFKVAYLQRNGRVVHDRKPSGESIKIVGSPTASLGAVNEVADDIHKMLRYSPRSIFQTLAANGAGLGIFHQREKLTIFPEYANLKDTPQCRGRCDGSCSITCTFDGRKWDNVAGIGGRLGLVLEENVLCIHDPYNKHDNIAVHEFGHVVDGYGFDTHMNQMKKDAFRNARAHKLWRERSYSMTNPQEYFGEATGAFFLVNKQSSPGGMNECYSGSNPYCRTEMDARRHLQQVDPKLYALLVYVYTSNRPQLPSGLTVCPQTSVVG